MDIMYIIATNGRGAVMLCEPTDTVPRVIDTRQTHTEDDEEFVTVVAEMLTAHCGGGA